MGRLIVEVAGSRLVNGGVDPAGPMEPVCVITALKQS